MLVTILLLPLLNFIILLVGGSTIGKKGSIIVTIINQSTSFILSLFLFFKLMLSHPKICKIYLMDWLSINILDIKLTFLFDFLTITMLVLIYSVSLVVHVYFLYSMKNEPHLQRFLSYLSLFTFFMVLLVTSNNFIQLFLGWEGLLVCLYFIVLMKLKDFTTQTNLHKKVVKTIIYIQLINSIGFVSIISSIYYLFQTFSFTEIAILLQRNTNFLNISFLLNPVILILISIFLTSKFYLKTMELFLHSTIIQIIKKCKNKYILKIKLCILLFIILKLYFFFILAKNLIFFFFYTWLVTFLITSNGLKNIFLCKMKLKVNITTAYFLLAILTNFYANFLLIINFLPNVHNFNNTNQKIFVFISNIITTYSHLLQINEVVWLFIIFPFLFYKLFYLVISKLFLFLKILKKILQILYVEKNFEKYKSLLNYCTKKFFTIKTLTLLTILNFLRIEIVNVFTTIIGTYNPITVSGTALALLVCIPSQSIFLMNEPERKLVQKYTNYIEVQKTNKITTGFRTDLGTDFSIETTQTNWFKLKPLIKFKPGFVDFWKIQQFLTNQRIHWPQTLLESQKFMKQALTTFEENPLVIKPKTKTILLDGELLESISLKIENLKDYEAIERESFQLGVREKPEVNTLTYIAYYYYQLPNRKLPQVKYILNGSFRDFFTNIDEWNYFSTINWRSDFTDKRLLYLFYNNYLKGFRGEIMPTPGEVNIILEILNSHKTLQYPLMDNTHYSLSQDLVNYLFLDYKIEIKYPILIDEILPDISEMYDYQDYDIKLKENLSDIDDYKEIPEEDFIDASEIPDRIDFSDFCL